MHTNAAWGTAHLFLLTLGGLVSPIKPTSYPYTLGDVCSIFLTSLPHSVFIYDFRATEAIEGLNIGLSDGICVSKHLLGCSSKNGL